MDSKSEGVSPSEKKRWFLSLKYVLLGLIKDWIKSFERETTVTDPFFFFFFSFTKRIHSVNPDSLKQIGIVSTSSLLTFIFEWSFLSSNNKLLLRFFCISNCFPRINFFKKNAFRQRYWENTLFPIFKGILYNGTRIGEIQNLEWIPFLQLLSYLTLESHLSFLSLNFFIWGMKTMILAKK